MRMELVRFTVAAGRVWVHKRSQTACLSVILYPAHRLRASGASHSLHSSNCTGDPCSGATASSTSLAASHNGTKEPQSPSGLPASTTGSAVENATSRFALPTPTLAVRNLVRALPWSMRPCESSCL
jgi:hypothetical protein